MTSSPRRAIVAGHGDFASGLVSAVAQITGRGELFSTLTNRGLCGDEMTGHLRDLVDGTGARVIFTDLPGGSCTIAARRLIRERPDVVLVTGANVATLLDFVCHEDGDASEAARQAAEKGRAAVGYFGAPSVA